MKIESTKGPAALVDVNGSDGEYSGGDDDDDDEEEEDSSDTEHDSEAENNKLRTYELNRLRLVTERRRIFFICFSGTCRQSLTCSNPMCKYLFFCLMYLSLSVYEETFSSIQFFIQQCNTNLMRTLILL